MLLDSWTPVPTFAIFGLLNGDFGATDVLGGFGVLDFRRGNCGLALALPTVAATTCLERPALVERFNDGRELESEVACDVEPDVSSSGCRTAFLIRCEVASSS